MRRFSVSTAIASAAGLVFASRLVGAVRVAPESECSRFCGNVLDDTRVDDIVCNEDSYSTGTGKVFSNCVTCELTSPYVYETGKPQQQTDQQWLLYNARFSTSYCLFGIPGGSAESNPCITSRACEPLFGSITFGNLTQNGGSYDYCAVWDSSQVGGCNSCLRAGSRNVLANLITVLDTGCRQQPVPGTPISVEGTPFSADVINATEPGPTLGAAYEIRSGFPLGASVGIAVGATVVILSLAACLIIWNGKRRRRDFLRRVEERNKQQGPALYPAASADRGWQNAISPASDHHDTPLSQRPLRSAWDDSPMSAYTDRALPRYWSPYTSPVGEESSSMEQQQQHQQFGSRLPEKTTTTTTTTTTTSPATTRSPSQTGAGGIGLALSGAGDLIGWGGGMSPNSKGKEKEAATPEAYEMAWTPHRHAPGGRHPEGPAQMPMQMPLQSQAPLLRHPGNGRQSQAGTPRASQERDLSGGATT